MSHFRGNPEDDQSVNRTNLRETEKGDPNPCSFAHSPNLRMTTGSDQGMLLALVLGSSPVGQKHIIKGESGTWVEINDQHGVGALPKPLSAMAKVPPC